MPLKIAESLAHKPCHTEAVGFDGGQLLAGIESRVLVSDAGTMEIQVHASQFVDEFVQTVNSLWGIDINHLVCHDPIYVALHLGENVFPSSGHADARSSACED